MPVQEVGAIYICSVCGNEVIVTKVGGGTLVCCGKEMTLPKKDEIEEDDEEKGEDEE